VDEYCAKYGPVANWSHLREAIVQDVKDSAYHIINYKGATNYAIGMALTRIVGTILQDQNSILTVSTLLDGEYGIKDVCLSVPCLVGQDGIKQIVEAKITPGEKEALSKSASILQNALQQLATA
jgi:L-lactate dehydrogenase